MKEFEGLNRPFWREHAQAVSYPKLAKDITVETLVVGGGISGILAAYYLAKAGKKVALIEAREFVSGTTGGTTAKLSAQHELIYDQLLREAGYEIASLYYDANEEGIKRIESIAKELEIDCAFERMDCYVFSESGKRTKKLQEEAKAYEEIRIDGSMTESIPLDFHADSALVMRNQAQFHPVTFLHGVLQSLDKMGVGIYQHTMYKEAERVDDQLVVSTDTPFRVRCEQVVFATLFPAEDPNSFYSETLEPVTSLLTAYENSNTPIDGMYISDDDSKRTFRGIKDDERHYLVIGGETYQTGDSTSTVQKYKSIENFVKEKFGLTKMLHYWSEHDLTTPDLRPYIGQIAVDDAQMYVMTGYNKWGLAAAATSAQLISDLIVGNDNRFKDLFSPQREIQKIRVEENEEDQQESSDSSNSDVERLEKGKAKRIEMNSKVVGVYKDTNENTHYLDLSCTHLGCEVIWNDADRTWDCPCHGSIFDGKGEVLAGPAKLPLKKMDPN